MVRHLDIFEKFLDGSSIWRSCVFGQFEVECKLQELHEHSKNEFVAINLEADETLSVRVPKKLRQLIKKTKTDCPEQVNALLESRDHDINDSDPDEMERNIKTRFFYPRCESTNLHRSKRRGILERIILYPLGFRAYRCWNCYAASTLEPISTSRRHISALPPELLRLVRISLAYAR